MPPKRTRRTAEQIVADLEAEIARVKARAAQVKARKDPALRHISGAVRAIDKASAASQDKATREALTEARATLTACLALSGVPTGGGAGVGRARKPRGPAPDPVEVLAYLKKHPGSRSEEICGEMGTDTAALRPVLHRLRDEGKVKGEGKARAMRYSAVG